MPDNLAVKLHRAQFVFLSSIYTYHIVLFRSLPEAYLLSVGPEFDDDVYFCRALLIFRRRRMVFQ